MSLVGGGRPLSKKIESFIADEDIIVKVKEVEESDEWGREERYRTLQKEPLLIYTHPHNHYMTFT